MWDEFGSWEADASYDAPEVGAGAVTDILQETQVAGSGSDQWTGFFQDVIKGAVGYATAKDAAQTRASIADQNRQAQYRNTATMQRQQMGQLGGQNLIPILLIGGVLLFVLKD